MPPKANAQSAQTVAKAPVADGPMTVRATKPGYYGDLMRQPGHVFQIDSAAKFSQRWMEPVEGAQPVAAPVLSEAAKAHKAIMSGAGVPKLQPNAAVLVGSTKPDGSKLPIDGGETATGDQSVI